MSAKTFFISLLVFIGLSAIVIGAMVYFSTNKRASDNSQNNTSATITLAPTESRVVGYIYSSGLTDGPAYQLTYLTKSASVINPDVKQLLQTTGENAHKLLEPWCQTQPIRALQKIITA